MLTMTSPTEPAALQGLLQSKFSDTGLTVANASTGGTSSSLPNELAGVDGGGQPAPVCDGSDPLQLQYVGVIDSVGQQLNVPVIPLYTYVQSVPDWQSHMQNCQIPDATLNQLEAQQAEKVIAPLIKTLIAE